MGERVEPSDDRALVEALRSGDPSAPRWLVERFQTDVFSLCYRMTGHRQDAEDVAQETFLRALRGIGGFDVERPIRPWLLGIAANRCRTALTRRRRTPGPVESAAECVDSRPPPGDPDDLAGELDRALERLRPEYRAVFTLFHEQNQPYEEIAQALGRPIGTVKTWLHRARAELAGHLSRRGVSC
jgi:RNA polymerase sigma factor (sigma-70 family)